MTDLSVYEGGLHPDCHCAIDASVLIPAYNPLPLLIDQLESLASQQTDRVWELVIADNGSTQPIIDHIRSVSDRFHRVVLIDASSRRGPAHARNAAASFARGHMLMFCDADDEADPAWLESLWRAQEPGTVLAARLDITKINGAEALRWRPPVQDSVAPSFAGSPYALAANLGVLRADFVALGGFDESFPTASGEDIDFALRAGASGMRVRFVPEAVMHYRLRSDRSGALAQARVYGRSVATLVRLHQDRIPVLTLADVTTMFAADVLYGLAVAARGEPTRIFRFNLSLHWAMLPGLTRIKRFWSLRRRWDSRLFAKGGVRRELRRAYKRIGNLNRR